MRSATRWATPRGVGEVASGMRCDPIGSVGRTTRSPAAASVGTIGSHRRSSTMNPWKQQDGRPADRAILGQLDRSARKRHRRHVPSHQSLCVQSARKLHTDCMKVNRRTQADRTAATRTALIAAARPLFAEHGYAAVSTPDLAAAAGVTRGALYHQFKDKQGLFLAVVNAVEDDLTTRLGETLAASGASDPAAALHAAVDAWLDACQEPEVRRVLLVDAPSVLGWDVFREIALAHGLGLTETLLQAASDAGNWRRSRFDRSPRRADRRARRGRALHRERRRPPTDSRRAPPAARWAPSIASAKLTARGA